MIYSLEAVFLLFKMFGIVSKWVQVKCGKIFCEFVKLWFYFIIIHTM